MTVMQIVGEFVAIVAASLAGSIGLIVLAIWWGQGRSS